MTLSVLVRSFQLRPRVVHRLPGRLRIHIPSLRQVSSEFQLIVNILLNDFTFPEGIDNVSINYITGNLLIHYDVNKGNEKDVLNWLNDLTSIAAQIWYKFNNSSNGNIDNISKKLLQFFSEASKNGNILDKNFIIPDYVWS